MYQTCQILQGKNILQKISESNVTSKEEIFFELEKMLKDCDLNWPDEQILEQVYNLYIL